MTPPRPSRGRRARSGAPPSAHVGRPGRSRATWPKVALALPCAAAFALAATAFAQVAPPKPSQAVPDPGRAVASSDDLSAIAVNPANLPFLPAPELRWTWVWTDSGAPIPIRGHSVALGTPLGPFATGLRLDFLDPPDAARAPFVDSYRWLRWALAFRAGEALAFGTTLGWGSSEHAPLDGFFSLTTGLTVRPSSFLSISAVARDLNRPSNSAGTIIPRSYDAGVAVRPFEGRRDFEVTLETAYHEGSEAWVPRATAGLDVPRLGRLRGDVSLRDPGGTPSVVALAGLDLNLGALQLFGGGVFGDAVTRSGSGFYAGASLRGFREPGIRLPARVARIRLDSTPGVRGHTRLLRRLWRLADDPEVQGVALILRAEPAATIAHAEELGDAIRTVRARGKKVFCHLEDAGGRSLFACSQADAIAMNPAGGLRFAGISASYMYFGDLLRKLDVGADFVRIGEHKLAPEMFTRSGPSPVARREHQEIVDLFNGIYLRHIGGGRGVSMPELQKRFEAGPYMASEARDAGLVDMLAYEDEIDRVAERVMGGPVRMVDDEPMERAPTWWAGAPKIAIVYLHGDMVDGESQSIPFLGVKLAGSVTVSRALRRAREDGSVRAVVFRISTGGGSTLASDVILREAMLTARAKPLIVSMGSAAASGGYYASVAGRTIYANRATVTGSIGIFYGKVDISGLLGKFGVRVEAVRASPRADAESLFRPFTDDERVQLGLKVKQFYDVFIGRVAEGRKMTPAAVDAVARGRVWTGQQALERKLVDKIGGLREALAEARALTGLPPDAPIIELPEEDESLLGFILSLAGFSAAQTQAAFAAAVIPPAIAGAAKALAPFLVHDMTRPMARMELAGDLDFNAANAEP